MKVQSERPTTAPQHTEAQPTRPEHEAAISRRSNGAVTACSVQSKTAQIAAKTRLLGDDATSAKIISTKDLVTSWFKEIVDDLQNDDQDKWSNVAIARHLGYSETTVRAYLTGDKHIAVHAVMRMPWSMRWRFMKRLSEHANRGGNE